MIKRIIFGLIGIGIVAAIAIPVGIYVYNRQTGSDISFPGKKTIDKTLGIGNGEKDKTEKVTTVDKENKVTPLPGGEKEHTSTSTNTTEINKKTEVTSNVTNS